MEIQPSLKVSDGILILVVKKIAQLNCLTLFTRHSQCISKRNEKNILLIILQ